MWMMFEENRESVFQASKSTGLRKLQETAYSRSEFSDTLTTLRSRLMLVFPWRRVG